MFPSHFPVPYLLHLVVVGVVLVLVCVASWFMGQPLGLAIAVFGLNALPTLPIVGESGVQEEEEPGDYDGATGAGFVR